MGSSVGAIWPIRMTPPPRAAEAASMDQLLVTSLGSDQAPRAMSRVEVTYGRRRRRCCGRG